MASWLSRRGDRDMSRRTNQIKEIVRLGAALRPDMSLHAIIAQVITSINRTIGFQVAALNLVSPESDVVEIAATAGVSPEQEAALKADPPQVRRLKGLMREEFRHSNSYFIDHTHVHLHQDMHGITVQQPQARSSDAWHPDDVLLVPLMSPRDGRMFAILSLDAPADGKIPSSETIDIIELFAGEAAHAIETARMFQERERERMALRSGLRELLEHIRQVRQGDLSGRSQGRGDLLGPLSQALNEVLNTHTQILDEVRHSAQVVELSASETRATAAFLATAAQQQALQTLSASGSIDTMAHNLRAIEETALSASQVAAEWSQMTNAGSLAASEAAQGMQHVRDMVLDSAHKIKRLGERAQEIEQSVRVVADIANRTNVLALNASIASARGNNSQDELDHIVREIRALAGGSGDAAHDIADRVEQMRHDTREAVASIERGTEESLRQASRAADASGALHQMHSANESLRAAIAQVAETATQLAREASGIAYDISDIARGSVTMRERMDHMREAMNLLVTLAEAMRGKISLFHLGTLSDLEPAIANRSHTGSGAASPSQPEIATSGTHPPVSRGLTSPKLMPLPDAIEAAMSADDGGEAPTEESAPHDPARPPVQSGE